MHSGSRESAIARCGWSDAYGAFAAVGDSAKSIVQSPFQLATAIGGTALEYSGLRSGHEYSDQLGGMIAGGVDTASGVYEHGPIDYASLKAGEIARSVQDAAAEGRYFDAGREGGSAVIGTALALTGTAAASRAMMTRMTPEGGTWIPDRSRVEASEDRRTENRPEVNSEQGSSPDCCDFASPREPL